MPSSGAYAHRFGSLIRAYSLVGFTPDRDYHYIEVNRLLRLFHGDEVERVIRKVAQRGAVSEKKAAPKHRQGRLMKVPPAGPLTHGAADHLQGQVTSASRASGRRHARCNRTGDACSA